MIMEKKEKVKPMDIKVSKGDLDENGNIIHTDLTDSGKTESIFSKVLEIQERYKEPKYMNPILGGSKIGDIMERMTQWGEQYEKAEKEPITTGQFLDYKEHLEYENRIIKDEIQELKKAILELYQNNTPKFETQKQEIEPIKLDDKQKIKGAGQIKLFLEVLEMSKDEIENMKANYGTFRYIISLITGMSDRHVRRLMDEQMINEHEGILNKMKENIPKR
jgi:hypothetical protein